jgi:hypothetical protein
LADTHLARQAAVELDVPLSWLADVQTPRRKIGSNPILSLGSRLVVEHHVERSVGDVLGIEPCCLINVQYRRDEHGKDVARMVRAVDHRQYVENVRLIARLEALTDLLLFGGVGLLRLSIYPRNFS